MNLTTIILIVLIAVIVLIISIFIIYQNCFNKKPVPKHPYDQVPQD